MIYFQYVHGGAIGAVGAVLENVQKRATKDSKKELEPVPTHPRNSVGKIVRVRPSNRKIVSSRLVVSL